MTPLESLTAREREALALFMEGLNSQEAADNLSISRRTIEQYRASILKKFGVKKIVQVARLVTSEDIRISEPLKSGLLDVLQSVKAMQEQLMLIEGRVQNLLQSDLSDQQSIEAIPQAQVPERRQRRRVRYSHVKRY